MRKGFLIAVSVTLLAGLFVSSVLVGSASATARRTATLTGAKEVPGPGDPNGTGKAVIKVSPSEGKVCYRLRWNNIRNPKMAHIHRGTRDVAGDVKVTLFDRTVRQDSIRGCVKGVARKLLRRIRNNPLRFYVNIHNRPYPEGAIRGQLRRPL